VSEVLWEPDPARREQTLLAAFLRRHGFEDYHEAWEWSTEDLPAFWEAVWADGEVTAERQYDQVMGEPRMPGTEWFSGARLSYAANLLRGRGMGGEQPAVIAAGEGRDDEVLSWDELRARVGAAQRGLAELSVGEGHRVAALMPNCAETVVLMLAATALGATFTSCSPDFGPQGVVDRFGQVRPTVLATVDGYRYAGKTHALAEKLDEVLARIEGVRHLVVCDFAGQPLAPNHPSVVGYDELVAQPAAPDPAAVPPDHPLYLMYSSGTTGAPKSMIHGHAGTLVKHLEEHRLQSDVRPGDVVFWFTTCGWMMWNWLVSALASGATVVCYDGSPIHPDRGALWRLAERHGITHFGTSPRYLAALAEAGVQPGSLADLSALRSLLSTGMPLLPEQFDWVYQHVGADLHLASVSGGTDLIGCFAGGVPTWPVRRGELQGRVLGMAVEAWDEAGEPVVGEKGELVCTRPFPSMPVGFYNDPDGRKYHEAYFATFPGVWTHGDFIEIRPHGGVVFYGRSDTTLNPGGVRIGTAEIYRAVEQLDEVSDSIVAGRATGGDEEVVLCVALAEGCELTEELADRIRTQIRAEASPRHVPHHVVAVPEVPYTINGKKVEKAVKKLLAGEPVDNRAALANPDCLDAFARLEL
jgi:acetoacetyl-CoA synthetase